MPKLSDVIQFRGDRIFHGAVSLDWLWTHPKLSQAAAESFIFHGPSYHGVAQQDIGTAHGHRLQDTASFTRAVLRRCHGLESAPFTLAIAGYGTGKSHLSLAMANMLTQPQGEVAERLVSAMETADPGAGAEVRAILKEDPRPFLVVALNGMQNFDLTAELTRQILMQACAHKLDTRELDELRPRFRQAASLTRLASEEMVRELMETCGMDSMDEVLEALNAQDEQVYTKTQQLFEANGLPIRALGGESARDVIDVAVREYCGENKHFAGMVILFDEFGRYTEFATIRSQIAGSGVLQDLFEGIQGNSEHVVFVGFIQFELNAYVQRVAPEFKNEILRYVSRYQSASKSYLSINLETLVANLIEKKDLGLLDSWFECDEAFRQSHQIAHQLHNWFPQSNNHRLWADAERFHHIIYKGCWPLSPFSMWLLFHLTAAGKHLQERSALALLGETLDRASGVDFLSAGSWSLCPVDLWSDALQEELLSSEELGQQGSIAHAYASAMAKYGSQLSQLAKRLLRAIVLAGKLGLHVSSREEATQAITVLAGISPVEADACLAQMQEEYNVIEWDGNFNQFDILGDAVPRSQFLSFLRQRVAAGYDEQAKATLFATRSQEWCDLLGNLDCDFAEQNRISTREWQFRAVTTQLQHIETQLKFGLEEWKNAIAIDEPKGMVFYCYVEPGRDIEATAMEVRRTIRRVEKEACCNQAPAFVTLMCDEEGSLGRALAELALLRDGISEVERAQFGNLVAAHQEKAQKTIRNQIESMLKEQRFITSFGDELQPARRNRFGTELFNRAYKKPLPFPFDGFSTARGNAADTCYRLILELLHGKLDFDTLTAKPAKEKNRALTVLSDSWGIFSPRGSVSRKPENPVARLIIEGWDRELKSDRSRVVIGQAIRSICLPPYGANIASASLLFAAFVAARAENLVVSRDGQILAVSQWLKEGIFRGKYLDLPVLDKDELLPAGGEASEWEELLDDWDQAESYLDESRYLEMAGDLKKRVPVPAARRDRLILLAERSLEARKVLAEMDRTTETALRKMQGAYERTDLSMLSWGAASLVELQQRMKGEKPLWTEGQIETLARAVEHGRQAVIELFPIWLPGQHPNNDHPDTIGQFKHGLLNKVGGNLKALGLDEECEQLKQHVAYLVRNAETAAEARQLLRDVKNWMDEHLEVFRIPHINEIRGLIEVGKGYVNKLRGMVQRIDMQELQEARTNLADFVKKLKAAESVIMQRAGAVWDSEIQGEESLDTLLREVEWLKRAFEGVDTDLEDIALMEQALKMFQQGYARLSFDSLTWSEFRYIADSWASDMQNALGEEELPWTIGETVAILVDEKAKHRELMSLAWMNDLENYWSSLQPSTASEANRIYEKAANPPPYVTGDHRERASKIHKQIEAQLEILKVEWLVEKFKELPDPTKKIFLSIVDAIIKGQCQNTIGV